MPNLNVVPSRRLRVIAAAICGVALLLGGCPRDLPQAAAPEITPASGGFLDRCEVNITSNTPGAVIRYTTDGSVPDSGADDVFTRPIELTDTTTVTAVATANGYRDSEPVVVLLFKAGTVKWAFETGGEIGGTPAIALDGTLYAGSDDGKLYAINPDGSKKWEFVTSAGGWSAPAIGSDGTVYAHTYSGTLYAINPDGTRRWDLRTGSGSGRGPSIAPDGTIYVAAADGSLLAVSADGEIQWEFAVEGHIGGPAAIAEDGTIYFGAERFYALHPGGTLKWDYVTDGRVSSSPALDDDGTIYFGAQDSRLRALNADGTLKWSLSLRSAIQDVMGGERSIRSASIGPDRTLYCVAYDLAGVTLAVASDGATYAPLATAQSASAPPLIGADGTIYTARREETHELVALRADGSVKWSLAVSVGSPTLGPDGTIYATDFDGTNWSICAIYGLSGGLADSPWPKYQGDARNSGALNRNH